MAKGLKRLNASSSVGNLGALDNIVNQNAVVDVCVYDTSKDPDGGAWRFSAQTLQTSWYNEALGTATRGNRKEFPSIAVIVAEAGKVTIYDADDSSLPMWMVFNSYGGVSVGILRHIIPGNTAITSVAMVGAILVVGSTFTNARSGADVINFTADAARHYTNGGASGYNSAEIGMRNMLLASIFSGPDIVNNVVNDVAITFLPDAPLDDYGMKIPTIAVATVGDTSIINNDGSVVNHTNSWIGSAGTQHVAFAPDGSLITVEHSIISGGATGVRIHPVDSFLLPSVDYTNGIVEFTNNTTPSLKFSGATIQSIIPNSYATSSGFVLHRNNPSSPANGMVAYLTNTYSTGYMVGDSRRCYLANSLTADRSVKAGTLTGAVATASNDSLIQYSNFTTAGVETQVTGETDFTTGSIILWASTNAGGTLLSRANQAVTSPYADFILYFTSTSLGFLESTDNATWTTNVSVALPATGMHQVIITKDGTSGSIYLNGKKVVSGLAGTFALQAGTKEIIVGGEKSASVNGYRNLHSGGLSLLRLSATAPTPKQIAFMYEQEASLFRPNAKALLSNAAVTALAYDESTDITHVGSANAVDELRGLAVIKSTPNSKSVKALSAANGVLAIGD